MTARIPGWTLAVSSVAIFMVSLDNLVVTNALTSIREDLGASIEALEWTVNAYTLAFAVFLLTGAALGDRFGRRRVFVIGLGVFTVASAAAALAPSTGALIAARALQGLGAAIVAPLSLTILSAATPAEKRGLALGIWSGVSGLGGPPTRLDLPGVALASAGLLGVVYGIVRGNAAGWGSPEVVGSIALGLVLVIGFVAHELRTPAPMLPMRFFRSRAFAATNGVSLAMTFGIFGAIFLLAQFFQSVQQYSPLEAGLRTLPWTGMPMIVAPIAGVLSDRIGSRPLMSAGLFLQAAAVVWIAIVTEPDVAYAVLVPAFVMGGTGMALVFAPAANAVLGAVKPEEAGQASGANNAIRELGGVLGVAVLAAVFTGAGGFESPQAFVDGLVPALWVGAAVLALGGLIAPPVPGKARAPRRAAVEAG